MVLGYHVVITAYGFWLPNDPRGSWSDFVGSWELFHFGPATKIDTRQSVADVSHDYQARKLAKQELKYPLVCFDGYQARAIGDGFAQAVEESQYQIYACAILPEHSHLVVGRHDRKIEKIVAHLKSKATFSLQKENRHPLFNFQDRHGRVPSPWAEKGWNVYLNTEKDIERAIRYVEANPGKENKPKQSWSFVIGFKK